MSSANEVKREFEGKLSEANANAKYLYSRVTELEKRNQKLEKKVKKLKKKRKELKEEVAKLRGTTPVQHIADDHNASPSDVELLEEPNFGSSQSNLDEELAVISDVNSNNVDDDTPAHIEGVHGSKKECSCHKMINSIEVKRHIREAHLGDTRVP